MIDETLDIEEILSQVEKTTLSVGEIIRRERKLDFSPPYQRNEVWNRKFQSDLINSILVNFPIGPLTFVKNESSTGWIVLDGKQRITSLKHFYDNEIDAKCKVNHENKIVNYNTLSKTSNEEMQTIFEEFESRKLAVLIFPWMKWEKQRDIFMRINQSERLKTNEKHYCDNFLTKQLLQYIYDITIKGLINTQLFDEQKSKKSRCSHLRFVHNIMYILYGQDFTSNQVRINAKGNINSSTIGRSANTLENKLNGLNYRDKEEITNDLLNKLGIYNQVKSIQNICKLLKPILTMNSLTSKWTNNVIRDAILFFTQKNAEKTFTISQMKEYTSLMHKVLSDYAIDLAQRGQRASVGANDVDNIQQRLDILEEIFIKLCKDNGIDTDVKNKDFTEAERKIAKLNSNGHCPICTKALTDNNCAVDHVECTSKFSSTVPVLLCKECNGRKSNWTINECQKIQKFIEEYSSVGV